MQNVSHTELARRLCEAEHPRVPPVRSPGGTPCPRHLRDANDFWPVVNNPVVLSVLAKAARDQSGALPTVADEAIMEAWGIIANAGGGDWGTQTEEWQQAAASWREHWLGVGAEPSKDPQEDIHGEPV